MNAIQSVRCSQYVNFLWGFVITNEANIYWFILCWIDGSNIILQDLLFCPDFTVAANRKSGPVSN